jgi:superfamily II DNA helicase RecQ
MFERREETEEENHRQGRDGKLSRCTLLWNPADVRKVDLLVAQPVEDIHLKVSSSYH